MRSERYIRLRAGILAGISASAVLFFVIWLFGYITGDRLGTSLLCIIAVGVGLICGAQVYVSNPEDISDRDEVLAELEELSQGKALGKPQTVASNKRRDTGKTA